MIYDVRTEPQGEITEIVFAEMMFGTHHQAFQIEKWGAGLDKAVIIDGDEFVVVTSVEHAENLKLALDKAIKLGWLK